MVPLNWRLAADELTFIVADCDPRVVFVGKEFVQTALQVAHGGNPRQTLVAVESGGGELEPFESFLASAPAPGRLPESGADDVILILYTSGTTGRPKGAMLTHRSLLRSTDSGMPVDPDWFRWHAGEVALIAMPVFHIGGTGQGLRALRGGCRVVVLREFQVDRVLETLARFRVGKLFLVPAAMQAVIRSPLLQTLDLSCLRCLLYGASSIPDALLHECTQTLRCDLVQMYGSTETSGTITALSPEDHRTGDSLRRRSAGKALPGVELAILDSHQAAVPTGSTGEIAVRSVANMVGYWNQAEATRETFTADRWMRTGDVGHVDADGYLFVLDRLKDMIISGGENIYPAEVERVLSACPEVAEVCVIGVQSERWGEEVKAVVVLRGDAKPNAAGIVAWARGRLAGYKLPKSVEFVSELPRNPSGKVLRKQLRQQFATRQEQL